MGGSEPVTVQVGGKSTTADVASPRDEGGRPQVIADRYVVGELLGAGGNGSVYAAHDRQLERTVAVKLLRGHWGLGGPDRARIAREARMLAKLSHPNVVTVFDLGESDGRVFVAMELVRGSDLSKWLRSESRSVPEVLAMFHAAARGLAAAHEAGIIHRDFKPSNVVVGEDGTVKVLDFGLAVLWADRSTADGRTSVNEDPEPAGVVSETVTREGTVVGTPRYMSPEQHRDQTLDERTDIYSLCVALFEALYGRTPWPRTGEPVADAMVKLEGPPTIPRRAGVPRRVRALIAAGLAVARDDRPAAMTDVVACLAPRRRSPWRAAFLGVSLLGVGALAMPRPGASPCADAARDLAVVWDDARAEALYRVQRSTDAADHIRSELDGWAEQWQHARRETCEATHVEHVQSEAMLDRTVACLDVRLAQLGRLVGALSAADTARSGYELQALAGLTPASECSTTRLLARGQDAIARPEATAIRSELAELQVDVELWQLDGVGERLDVLEQRAQELDHPALVAETLFVQSSLAFKHGAVGPYLELLERAAIQAQRGEDRLTRSNIWVRLASARGGQLDDMVRARHDLELAEAALHGLPEDEPEWLGVAIVRANLLQAAGHGSEALPHAEHALALAHRNGKASRIIPAQRVMATALAAGGRLDEAEDQFEQSLTLARTRGGERNPQVIQVLSDLGLLAAKRGDLEQARTRLERALSLAEQYLHGAHPLVGRTQGHTALVLMRLGSEARARELAQRALASAEQNFGPQTAEAAGFRMLIGDASRRLGDTAAAREQFERVLEIYGSLAEPQAASVSTAKFELAKILGDDQRDRASALAREARDLAAEAGAPASILDEMSAFIASL